LWDAHPGHEAPVPQRCAIGLGSGGCGGHLYTVNCRVQETNLKLFKLCDMVHYPAGSSHQRMGNTVANEANAM